MKRKIDEGDLVVQGNELVEAAYDSDLTATEHKILRYAASKIKKNPNNFPDITFGVKEFMNAAGLKGNNYHSQIIRIADELTRKRIKLQHNDATGWFPWLSALVYQNGIVYLSFNTKIKPMLTHLEGQFTQYGFQYIGDMKSGYSIRLFELLRQYSVIGRRKVNLDVLKNMLGVADKYKQYGQFKLRVLKNAKRELDKKGGLTFEFEEIKHGRKVQELNFIISVNDKELSNQLDLFNDPESETFMKEAKLLLDNYNMQVSDSNIKNWSKYGINLLNDVLEEVKNRKMKQPAAYITTVLQSKQKERDQAKDGIESETNDIQDYMMEFILENRSNEIRPEWHIRKKFFDFMASTYTEPEIEEAWDNNKSHILKKISK